MNAQVLIDGVVRHVTILVAQLATTGGVRAPLAHLANQVFLELARELESQGISKQVSADMFGMALRSYRRRIQRLEASSTDREGSIWEAMLDYLGKAGVVTRADVLQRFHRDDPELVKSVLHDACESGLVFRLGSGKGVAYRAATEAELSQLGQRATGFDEFVWLLNYREGPLTEAELGDRVPAMRDGIAAALERLVAAGRVTSGTEGRYTSKSVVMAPGETEGWEAGMLDHFQAVVRTLCTRLRAIADDEPSPDVGGSTYSLRVWPGHPMEEEVRGLLAAFRRKHTELRRRVQEYNEKHAVPGRHDEVIVYGGQCILAREQPDNEEPHASRDPTTRSA